MTVLVGAMTLMVAWFLLVLLPVGRTAWSLAAGSGSTPLDLLLPADPSYRLSARVDGTKVTGSGETSLPDGSRVTMWAMFAGDEPGIHMSDTQDAVVAGGQFSATFDLAGWPAGPVMVDALFEMDEHQPAEARQRYGEDGSRMSGPIGTFSATGPLVQGRTFLTMTLLGDGRVLVAGGFYAGDNVPASETYAPEAGAFAPGSELSVATDAPTGTLLLDGRVLVAGGYDNWRQASRAQIYRP
jgi:hypothetical protein